MGDVKPGDNVGDGGFGTTYTAGWQRSDGTYTYNQNDPDFNNSPEHQKAKAQGKGGQGKKGK